MHDNHLFHQLFVADVDPGKVFIERPDGAKITYADAAARSAQIAHALVELGASPGDRVIVQVAKSVEALLLYLGCVRAGAVFIPLNTAYTATEVAYFIGDAEPAVVVCDPAGVEAMTAIAHGLARPAQVVTLDRSGKGSLTEMADHQATTFDNVARGPDDLAAILYTSGTTGRSKGAMLSHENLASNARILRDYWQVTSADKLLHALPIFHTHGLFVATNTLMVAGGSLLFLAKFDADTVVRQLPAATMMMGVPTFYARLLAHDEFDKDLVGHMRLFISGSAPLSAETHRRFSARTGHAILERYGMTETNMNTSNPYDGDRRAGTVGFPLPGVDLRIVDAETGAPLPDGEIGIIEVRGPNVFSGYWQMPEKTAEEFRDDGFFITGDMGMVDDRGYVSIVGRDKDLIISGGFNIYPAEVEAAIDEIPGVAENAVIGVPHGDFGEGVTAVIAPDGSGDVSESAVQAALAAKLAKFKIPKRVMIVDALPRNTMGKIQKNALRQTYQGLYADDPGSAR